MKILTCVLVLVSADTQWAETMRMSPLFTLGLYGFVVSWILISALVLHRRAKHPRQEIAHLQELSRPELDEESATEGRKDHRWPSPD